MSNLYQPVNLYYCLKLNMEAIMQSKVILLQKNLFRPSKWKECMTCVTNMNPVYGLALHDSPHSSVQHLPSGWEVICASPVGEPRFFFAQHLWCGDYHNNLFKQLDLTWFTQSLSQVRQIRASQTNALLAGCKSPRQNQLLNFSVHK